MPAPDNAPKVPDFVREYWRKRQIQEDQTPVTPDAPPQKGPELPPPGPGDVNTELPKIPR